MTDFPDIDLDYPPATRARIRAWAEKFKEPNMAWDTPPANLTPPRTDLKDNDGEFFLQDELYTINSFIYDRLQWRRKGDFPANMSRGDRWKTTFGKKQVIAVVQSDSSVAYFNVSQICGCGRTINNCYPDLGCNHPFARNAIYGD